VPHVDWRSSRLEAICAALSDAVRVKACDLGYVSTRGSYQTDLGQVRKGNLHDTNHKIVVILPLHVPNQPSPLVHTIMEYIHSGDGNDSQCHQGGGEN
jgi:hypothetical protein